MRHNNSKAAKSRRREEAEARNAVWTVLRPEQQLASLQTRPGSSARQTARIQKMMGA